MKNSRLNITEVETVTRQLCNLMEEKDYEVISVGVSLIDNGVAKDYLTYLACPVDEITEAMFSVEGQNGCELCDYSIPAKYCHITTFENNMHSQSLISFGEEDNYPVKANINPKYFYVKAFFHSYLKYFEAFHGLSDYWDYVNNRYKKSSSNKMLVRK